MTFNEVTGWSIPVGVGLVSLVLALCLPGTQIQWSGWIYFSNGHSRAVAQSLFWTEARIESISLNYVFVLALGIGIVAGLRSLTAPAVRGMGRAPQLVESARLAACVHGINDGGRDIFPARDRRVNRRQTADDSETHCACAVNGAHRHRRPLWRMSLCCGGEIIARGNAAWWNRRHCRRFSRLQHQETSSEQFPH